MKIQGDSLMNETLTLFLGSGFSGDSDSVSNSHLLRNAKASCRSWAEWGNSSLSTASFVEIEPDSTRKRMQSFAVEAEIHCFAVQNMGDSTRPTGATSQNWSHKWKSRYTQSIFKIRSSKADLIYRPNYGELTVNEASVEHFQAFFQARKSCHGQFTVCHNFINLWQQVIGFLQVYNVQEPVGIINKSFKQENCRGVIEVQYHTCRSRQAQRYSLSMRRYLFEDFFNFLTPDSN